VLTPESKYELIEGLLVYLNADESRCQTIDVSEICIQAKGLIKSEYLTREHIELGLKLLGDGRKLDYLSIRR
jgi:hypothetical protein